MNVKEFGNLFIIILLEVNEEGRIKSNADESKINKNKVLNHFINPKRTINLGINTSLDHTYSVL